MKQKQYSIDMLHGALLPKIVLFTVPLILSGCLQLAFNAADVIVVGRFASENALAAVGSTTSLISLLVNLFIGLSIGANVVMAHDLGAGDDDGARKTVHTSILMSLISGFALIAVGLLAARVLLRWMGSPDNVIDLSALYLRIYFIGMPATMLYNFGSALLRATGDTRRPLYYLTISGCINVPLNLFFVIVCKLHVAGVAIATVISQVVSALLVLRCLMRMDGACQLVLQQLHIDPQKLKRILRIGLPAGIQSTLFSISNVMIQSSVNSFGSIVMAGSAASSSIEGFVYTSMNSVHQAAVSFASQNLGAGKLERLNKILFNCLGLVVAVGLIMGWGAYLGGPVLVSIYSNKPEVIARGIERLAIICTTYFLDGILEVLMGMLRGLGYSVLPMLVSLTGICLLRIVWIATIFQRFHTPQVLYLSYPVSWILTSIAHATCLIIILRRLHRQHRLEQEDRASH